VVLNLIFGGGAAPSQGEIPFPNLLDGYPSRPAWQVPGVDYGVGPIGTLVDWQSASGTGISVNAGTGLITLTGNGVILSGYDLSTNGGCRIQVSNATNWTVTNCKMVNGSLSNAGFTAGLLQSDTNSPGGTVTRCLIDGGTPTYGAGGSTLISIRSGGVLIFEYNYLRNSPQHAWEIEGTNITMTRRYNVIYNMANGGFAGNHANTLQFGNAFFSASADCNVNDYNLIYQPPISVIGVDAGECDQFYDNNAGVILRPKLRFCVFVCAGGTGGDTASYVIHGGQQATGGVAEDNWFDTSGAYGPWYPGSIDNWAYARNYNLVTGSLLGPPP
jgi:hypothetical protein